MRILFVTEEPIQFSGTMVRGGQIHIQNVVEGLRDRGHDVHLIDWNSEPDRPFQHSIEPRSRFVDGAVRTFWKVIQVGRSISPDVIVSKTHKTYLAGWAAARRLDVPHVVHVGSSLERPTTGLYTLSMASFRTRLRFPHDGYFVVCQYLADQLGAVGVADNRVYDVRNAVDTERFHPEKVPEPLDDRFRRQLGALDDRPRLGFVGGLHREKGLNDLAEAVERMTTDPVVVVAGDGPERFQLEDQFGSTGRFLGAVSYEQMPALYHEFDAFVLPSHTEGLPRVVLEAQATGTPVVATRVGGVPEVVSEGNTGRLVDPGEPKELASVLNPLLTDEAERRRLGDNGRAAIESDLSWNALYDRYERYLTRLLG